MTEKRKKGERVNYKKGGAHTGTETETQDTQSK